MRVYEYNPFVIIGFLNLNIFFLIRFFKENPNVVENNNIIVKIDSKK